MLFATLLALVCVAAAPFNLQSNDAGAALPRDVLGEVIINRAVASNAMQSSHHGKRQDPTKPPEAIVIDLELPDLVPAFPDILPHIPDHPGSGPLTPLVDVSVPVDKIVEESRNRIKEALERLHAGHSIDEAYRYMQQIADAMASLAAAQVQAGAQVQIRSAAPEEV